jgi:hypothetical protein
MKKILCISLLSFLFGCQKQEVETETVSKPVLISITIDSKTTETVRVSN